MNCFSHDFVKKLFCNLMSDSLFLKRRAQTASIKTYFMTIHSIHIFGFLDRIVDVWTLVVISFPLFTFLGRSSSVKTIEVAALILTHVC